MGPGGGGGGNVGNCIYIDGKKLNPQVNQAVKDGAMTFWGVSTAQWLHFVQGERSQRAKSSWGGRETATSLFTTGFAIVRLWVSTAIMLRAA